MIINEQNYRLVVDSDNNLFVFSRDNNLLVICDNINSSNKYYKITFVPYENKKYTHIIETFIYKYFNNICSQDISSYIEHDEYVVGILSTPLWVEFNYNKSLPFMQIVNILDDATVYGLEIKVENGKIYYQH